MDQGFGNPVFATMHTASKNWLPAGFGDRHSMLFRIVKRSYIVRNSPDSQGKQEPDYAASRTVLPVAEGDCNEVNSA